MFSSHPIRSRLLFAALTGLLVAAGFPGHHFPTLSLGWLLPLAFVPLFVCIDTLPIGTSLSGRRTGFAKISGLRRGVQAFLLCWISGIVMTSFAFYWITYPAILFGGIPQTFTYAGFSLYCLLAGLFFPTVLSPFILNAVRGAKRGQRPLPILAMAIVSTVFEIIAPRFFHWSLGSLMHSVPEINQISSVFGFSFISGIIIYTGALVAHSFTSQPRSPGRVFSTFASLIGIWGGLFGWGYWRIQSVSSELSAAPTTRIGFIQPNFTFAELSSNATRPTDAQQMSLQTLLNMSENLANKASGDRKLDLIVWPESVAPSDFHWSKEQLEVTKTLTKRIGVPILAQAIEFDSEDLQKNGFRNATMYSNSFLVRPDGSRSASFRKWFPIPFGEMVPGEQYFPAWGDFVRNRVGNTSKVGIGTSYDALPYSPDFYIAPLICFDSILPSLPRQQARYGKASIFVNQANFVWMDVSNAGLEFAEIDRFRAIENGRSILLAANTGPSIAFDPIGRALMSSTKTMGQDAGWVDMPVWTETTLYSRWGDSPLLIAGIVAAVALLIAANRGYRRAS